MTYPGQFYPSSWVEVALWCNWMPQGVQFCRGCSCPYCEDPDDEPEPDSFRTLGLRQSDFL